MTNQDDDGIPVREFTEEELRQARQDKMAVQIIAVLAIGGIVLMCVIFAIVALSRG